MTERFILCPVSPQSIRKEVDPGTPTLRRSSIYCSPDIQRVVAALYSRHGIAGMAALGPSQLTLATPCLDKLSTTIYSWYGTGILPLVRSYFIIGALLALACWNWAANLQRVRYWYSPVGTDLHHHWCLAGARTLEVYWFNGAAKLVLSRLLAAGSWWVRSPGSSRCSRTHQNTVGQGVQDSSAQGPTAFKACDIFTNDYLFHSLVTSPQDVYHFHSLVTSPQDVYHFHSLVTSPQDVYHFHSLVTSPQDVYHFHSLVTSPQDVYHFHSLVTSPQDVYHFHSLVTSPQDVYHFHSLVTSPQDVYHFHSLVTSPQDVYHFHSLVTSPQDVYHFHSLVTSPQDVYHFHSLVTSPQDVYHFHSLVTSPQDVYHFHSLVTSPQDVYHFHSLVTSPQDVYHFHSLVTSPQDVYHFHSLVTSPQYVYHFHSLVTSPQDVYLFHSLVTSPQDVYHFQVTSPQDVYHFHSLVTNLRELYRRGLSPVTSSPNLSVRLYREAVLANESSADSCQENKVSLEELENIPGLMENAPLNDFTPTFKTSRHHNHPPQLKLTASTHRDTTIKLKMEKFILHPALPASPTQPSQPSRHYVHLLVYTGIRPWSLTPKQKSPGRSGPYSTSKTSDITGCHSGKLPSTAPHPTYINSLQLPPINLLPLAS
uniref:Uncharacterized protein n=1 Tax=Timema douglasi TaxID=61478 RepID=A0A7R8VSR8_TIMDO|nr:unnamed protein product [Timema douglasi]